MSELINNRASRINVLKDVIKHLHEGQPPEQVKDKLRELVRQTDYSEIVDMEQQLMAEGMSVNELKSMCDLHSQVTREVLVQVAPAREIAPGHPVDTFRRENEALRAVVAIIRNTIAALQANPSAADELVLVLRLRQQFNELMDIDKHYQRKEHALFSCLERHGITGPSKVMWAKDDDVRAQLKELSVAAQAYRSTVDLDTIIPLAESAVAAVEEMVHKEEQILLPMSLDTLTEAEWAEIWEASPTYGWCLVEPRSGYVPTKPAPEAAADGAPQMPSEGVITLPNGTLTIAQLKAIFSALPLDLTFVDARDRVAFFTEGPDRIFPRSRAVLGRKVQHCHPPQSLEVVSTILNDFRSGRQNVAEFWINFQGKFVHIRYFAVRDAAGTYLGTVELTQDLAPLRQIEGERRLLEYAAPEQAVTPK